MFSPLLEGLEIVEGVTKKMVLGDSDYLLSHRLTKEFHINECPFLFLI
jgi:hypothetical protein